MMTKNLHKQQRGNLYISIVWTAVLAFLGYLIYQIYLHGTGKPSGGIHLGLKGIASSLLRKLEKQGHEDLAKWILIALCAAAAVYVLIQIIVSLRHVMPKQTTLGQALCRQAGPNENFQELCRQIDHDMESGHKEFGGSILVSSSWILEDEIMRINRIQKIYDKTASDEKSIVLEDVAGNHMTIEFFMREWAQELLTYFQQSFPMIKIIQGSEDTGENIGQMFSWHVPKTMEEIQEYKDLAEQKGDAHAQTEYGKCLLFGKGGSTPDGTAAYAWFQKAAAQSNEIAKMYVGHCKLYGIGVQKNETEGYEMLNNALNYNYPEDSSSQPLANYSTFENEDLVQLFWDLGNALEKSLGVVQNYRVAVYYFTMIDDWGHPEGGERMRHYKKGISGWKKID